MRLLAIGGAGMVGEMLLPYLRPHHEVRVLDVKPPSDPAVAFFEGSATDYDAVSRAAEDVDAVLYLAMGPKSAFTGSAQEQAAHFDAGPKGLWVSLRAAHDAGVRRAVYASSMSVFTGPYGLDHIPPDMEDYPEPDAREFYGLAKRLGEQVCAAAAEDYRMRVVALRLVSPRSDEEWPLYTEEPAATLATAASDVAAVVESALSWNGTGFVALPVSGDREGRLMNLAATRRELGWVPRARRETS